jgi:hypothetical protein
MKKIYLLICLLFFLLSCSKEHVENAFIDGEMLLSSILIDGQEYYKYVYDEEGRILEEKSKFYYTCYRYAGARLSHSDHYVDVSIYSSSLIRTDREEWVNPENTEKYSSMKYDYDEEGRLLECCNYLGCSKFVYNSSGRISRRVFYREEKVEGFQDYSYDQSGNLEVQKHYFVTEDGQEILQSTREFEYDDKKNPFQVMSELMLPGKYTNPNNIIREIYTCNAEAKNEVSISEYSYIYNDQSYPVKRDENLEYVYQGIME